MAQHISYYLPELKKRLLARNEKPEIEIKTLKSLNEKLWGIQRGKLYVVGARTSNGKSAFILQLAFDVASQGHPVLMLSLEMDTYSILERALSQDQKISNLDLLHGKISSYLPLFTVFEKKAEDINLVIDDSIGKTWEEIDKHIASLSVKPEVIIIDHIHEVKKSAVQERSMIDEYIRRFKEMAIRHNFAGILCAQINRTSQNDEDKRPRLHQLKSSGYLEESCDFGILLHYPYQLRASTDINHFDVFVDKNRNGRTGHVRLHFQPETYRFSDVCQDVEPQEEPKKGWEE